MDITFRNYQNTISSSLFFWFRCHTTNQMSFQTTKRIQINNTRTVCGHSFISRKNTRYGNIEILTEVLPFFRWVDIDCSFTKTGFKILLPKEGFDWMVNFPSEGTLFSPLCFFLNPLLAEGGWYGIKKWSLLHPLALPFWVIFL